MINAELLNNAGIDYAAGMKRFMNDMNLYEAVLTAFLNEDILERAETAYKKGDYEGLTKVVHEGKGSVGNAGLEKIYAEASILMKLLRSPSYTENELKQAYEKFRDTYAAVREGIRAALGL